MRATSSGGSRLASALNAIPTRWIGEVGRLNGQRLKRVKFDEMKVELRPFPSTLQLFTR